MINEHERRLDRKQAAEFLTELGYRTAHATLAKLACIGGGPIFQSTAAALSRSRSPRLGRGENHRAAAFYQ
jgi:hypothetical protein